SARLRPLKPLPPPRILPRPTPAQFSLHGGTMAEIQTVAVLGCGLMGSGIAEVTARAGYRTLVREVSDELCERGMKAITRSLDRAVEKGKIDAATRDQ